MSKGRKLLAWSFAVATAVFVLILLGSAGADLNLLEAATRLGAYKTRSDVITRLTLKSISGLVAICVSFFLFRFRANSRQITNVPDGPLDAPSSVANPVGMVFDPGSLGRGLLIISEVRPPTIRGRVQEIRRWEDKGIFFTKTTLGFHLNYDRSPADYGDLLVRLRLDYFRRLRLEEGDDLEIELKWRRRSSQAHIACVRNRTSGQRFEPQAVSDKAGVLEGIGS